jgi:hypothetical protein
VPEKGSTKSSPKAEAPSKFESPKKPLTPLKKPAAEPLNSKSNNSSKASPTKKLPTPVKSTIIDSKVATTKPSDTNSKPRVSTKAPKNLDPSLSKKREAKASAKDSLIVEIRKSQLSQDDKETILGKRKADPSEHEKDGETSSVRKSRRIQDKPAVKATPHRGPSSIEKGKSA